MSAVAKIVAAAFFMLMLGVWYPNASGASTMPLLALGLFVLAIVVGLVGYLSRRSLAVAPGAGTAAGSAIRGWIASSVRSHTLVWTWVGITFAAWTYLYGLSLFNLGSRTCGGWWALLWGALIATFVIALITPQGRGAIATAIKLLVKLLLLFCEGVIWLTRALVGLLARAPFLLLVLVAVVIVFTVFFILFRYLI